VGNAKSNDKGNHKGKCAVRQNLEKARLCYEAMMVMQRGQIMRTIGRTMWWGGRTKAHIRKGGP
jgi:hypothetical protein